MVFGGSGELAQELCDLIDYFITWPQILFMNINIRNEQGGKCRELIE